MIDIWYMLMFGVIGYVFKKLDYPLAPLVLALVLGDLAENALRQSLIMSQGSLSIFVTRPIAGAITAVASSSSCCRAHCRGGLAGGREGRRRVGAAPGARGPPMDMDFPIRFGKIVLIDLALAGDNALVIALAVRTLPPRQQGSAASGARRARSACVCCSSRSSRSCSASRSCRWSAASSSIWIAIELVRQGRDGGDRVVRGRRCSRRSGSSSWPTW